MKEGWLTQKQCEACDWGNNPEYVDYASIYASRSKLLRVAFANSQKNNDKSQILDKNHAFQNFVAQEAFWLNDYALYMAVKDVHKGISWSEWEDDIRLRKPTAIAKWQKELKEEILFYQFQQYLFITQWRKLKQYANEKGVSIIGDIPIYVAFDSADTWANPELFQLDAKGLPTGVAGCPPDAFSATGQLWGNPLYRWDYHKETGYDWWMKRIAHCFELHDVVRIDHFRGFDEYYNIPYGDATAEFGKWEKGPGYDLFRLMKEKLGNKPVIAEDLGMLTKSVIQMVKKSGYPGMKVLQFAFNDSEESDYLPHNYSTNAVVYTGTHDNDTSVGWYQTLNRHDKGMVCRYLNIKSGKNISWDLLRAALSSVADTAIIPMQDYLGLGTEARINMPSTLGNNWQWRMLPGQTTEELAEKIYKLNKLYGRTKH